jgi:hypothetical protein
MTKESWFKDPDYENILPLPPPKGDTLNGFKPFPTWILLGQQAV